MHNLNLVQKKAVLKKYLTIKNVKNAKLVIRLPFEIPMELRLAIQNIGKHENLNNVCRNSIARNNWKLIGSGVGGLVYEHPTIKQYVLKIFKDRAYRNYVDFVRLQPENVHFPKILHVEKLGEQNGHEIHAVIMEKLETNDNLALLITGPISYVVRHKTKYDARMNKKWPMLGETIDKIKIFSKEKKHSLDIHTGNVMFRGDCHCPVITDPVVF